MTDISLNQFAPNNPTAGLYVYMANLPQLHNVIVSENQTDALQAGAVVTIDGTVTNSNAVAALQADVTDTILGVVTYSPVQNSYGAGERISVARSGDIIYMPADGAVSAGAVLYFNESNQVTATAAAGNSVIGKALTYASAEGDYVQVELGFTTTEEA